ncbi:MAG: o-succinylbenzoate synthase [Chloroflexota bacterium]
MNKYQNALYTGSHDKVTPLPEGKNGILYGARLYVADVFRYDLVYKRPARTSRGALTTLSTFFLRLAQPTSGLAGWGECSPMPILSVDDRPDYSTKLGLLCQQINDGVPPETIKQSEFLSEFPSIAFGLEMALLDLLGGGNQRLFEGNFTDGRPIPTHGLIWMDSIDGVLAQIEDKLAQGYSVLKMKVGALPLPQECEILAAIRHCHPAQEVEIRLDANGAFDEKEALTTLETLAPYDIAFLEQPIHAGQCSEMARLCSESPIPIGLDEELIGISPEKRDQLLSEVQPQHIVLKPKLLGGFTACQEWIQAAKKVGCTWWINSLLESNIGLNAICQWTASLSSDPSENRHLASSEETAENTCFQSNLTIDTQRVHGLGTGQLYQNNIPSPLQVVNAELVSRPGGKWDFSEIINPLIDGQNSSVLPS